MKDIAEKKKRMMGFKLTKQIIEKHNESVCVVNMVKQYKHSTCMICTILKQKELIEADNVGYIESKSKNMGHQVVLGGVGEFGL